LINILSIKDGLGNYDIALKNQDKKVDDGKANR
jgi:hypothetical protein